jgi:hypothetical protein
MEDYLKLALLVVDQEEELQRRHDQEEELQRRRRHDQEEELQRRRPLTTFGPGDSAMAVGSGDSAMAFGSGDSAMASLVSMAGVMSMAFLVRRAMAPLVSMASVVSIPVAVAVASLAIASMAVASMAVGGGRAVASTTIMGMEPNLDSTVFRSSMRFSIS